MGHVADGGRWAEGSLQPILLAIDRVHKLVRLQRRRLLLLLLLRIRHYVPLVARPV